jgi:rare lipoprotein A
MRARSIAGGITHRWLAVAATSALLAACSGAPPRAPDDAPARPRDGAPVARTDACAMPQVTQRRAGGFYLDDGPGQNIPPNLGEVPDAVPRLEPLRPANMRPYEALGRSYQPFTQLAPYKEQGIASWYGRRYHGQKTASGEVYDMYAMTAAHPILPIPSYARVTNLRNGRSVVVRINDRGPFHDGRVIDLSYTAACKLDVLAGGSTRVEVETIIPDGTTMVAAAPAPKPRAPAAVPPTASSTAATPAPAATPITGTPLEMDGVASPAAAPATAATTAAAEPAAVMPVSAEGSGFFLQLGAFASRENADNFASHLRAQANAVARSLQVIPRDGLFRVQAGPYGSQADARAAADRLAASLGVRAMVISR